MSEQGGIISLLPESRRRLDISTPGENRPLFYGVGVVLLVILLFVVVKLYTSYLTNQLAGIENELNLTEGQRDKEFEQEAIKLNKQFSLVGNLLGDHLIWSNVLTSIQNLTPPQIQIKTILGNTSEAKLEVGGRAVNYTAIAKQIAALLSDKSITDINLDKISVFSSGVLEYNMRVLFDKNNFLLNKTDTTKK